MTGINPLPREQEALEIRERHGLNFSAQPIQRQPVNARQQPPIAPFKLPNARMKLSAQNESLDFQSD